MVNGHSGVPGPAVPRHVEEDQRPRPAPVPLRLRAVTERLAGTQAGPLFLLATRRATLTAAVN